MVFVGGSVVDGEVLLPDEVDGFGGEERDGSGVRLRAARYGGSGAPRSAAGRKAEEQQQGKKKYVLSVEHIRIECRNALGIVSVSPRNCLVIVSVKTRQSLTNH